MPKAATNKPKRTRWTKAQIEVEAMSNQQASPPGYVSPPPSGIPPQQDRLVAPTRRLTVLEIQKDQDERIDRLESQIYRLESGLARAEYKISQMSKTLDGFLDS